MSHDDTPTTDESSQSRRAFLTAAATGLGAAAVPAIGAAATTSSRNVCVCSGETDTNKSGNTRVGAYARPDDDEMGALANSSGIGNGQATARLYGTFYPFDTGTHRVSVDYFRAGTTYNGGTGFANAEFSIFVRPGDGGVQKTTVESPSGKTVGDTDYSATFALEEGVATDVGLEVYCESNEPFGAGSIADYFNDIPTQNPDNRRVDVNDIQVNYVG